MPTSRLIALEQALTKRRHSHDGYYGGEFWMPRHAMQASTGVNASHSGELHERPGQGTGRVVRPNV